MDTSKFLDYVDADEELEYFGIDEEQRTVIIKHGPTKALLSVGAGAVKDNDWETIRAVLHGERESRVLSHMTRIVGYYSQIENWNKSKLGELDGRRKGNYAIPEAQ